MFQSHPGRLVGLHRHAQHGALAHTARLSRTGTRLSRLAAAVAAASVALLASAAAIPAAFAQQTQATVHHTGGGGLTGWQIALIGVGVPVAATLIVLVSRAHGARGTASSPNA
jgi:hypothetical protein